MLIGKHYIFRNMEATIFPEFAMIIDMIENENDHWVAISREEFDAKLAECEEKLTKKEF